MKVLFVLQSIGYGGSMTSMINLLSLLKNNNIVDADVLLMDPYGELYEELKQYANILETDNVLKAVTIPREKLKLNKQYYLLLMRALICGFSKMSHNSTTKQGYLISARKYKDKYDCVIAYQESVATNFVQYIKARKRIAWVHNDYENVLTIYENRDRLQKVYSAYDKIVCVSKAGANNFKKYSGIAPDKIIYIYNALPVNILQTKADVALEYVLPEGNKDRILNALNCDCLKLVSSGRFATQKRFDRVIDAAVLLKNQGYEFKWFILGNGVLFEEIESKILKYHLQDCVYLTGGLANPFPMIKRCDVFVLTSEFEAHPMVANEALILGTPVISTNFESASEVVTDYYNGIICGMSSGNIAKSIEKILVDLPFFLELKQNTEKFIYDNETIVNQVIEVIQ